VKIKIESVKIENDVIVATDGMDDFVYIGKPVSVAGMTFSVPASLTEKQQSWLLKSVSEVKEIDLTYWKEDIDIWMQTKLHKLAVLLSDRYSVEEVKKHIEAYKASLVFEMEDWS
jgi:hypothetical protein